MYLALKNQLDVKTLYSHIKQSQQKTQIYAVISASNMHDKSVLRAALVYIQAEERRKAQWLWGSNSMRKIALIKRNLLTAHLERLTYAPIVKCCAISTQLNFS